MNAHERFLKRTVERLVRLPAEERRWVVGALTVTERRTLEEFWPGWAHDGQLPPGAPGARNAPACAGAQAAAPAGMRAVADPRGAGVREDAGGGGVGVGARAGPGAVAAGRRGIADRPGRGDARGCAQGDGRGAERAAGGGADGGGLALRADRGGGALSLGRGGLSLFGGVPAEIARARASFRLVRRDRQVAACEGRVGQSVAGAAAGRKRADGRW